MSLVAGVRSDRLRLPAAVCWSPPLDRWRWVRRETERGEKVLAAKEFVGQESSLMSIAASSCL